MEPLEATVVALLVLTPVGAVVWAILGNRPRTDRFAAANHIVLEPAEEELVGDHLRANRRGRVAGAIVGLGVMTVIVVTLGSRAPAVLIAAGVLLGSLVGIAVSRPGRVSAESSARRASLTARRTGDYRPRHADRILTLAVVAAVLGAAIVGATADDPRAGELTVLAAAAAGAVGIAWFATDRQRRVVEEARPPSSIRDTVDDALRSATVRALHHAALGAVLALWGVIGLLAVETSVFDGVVVDGEVLFEVPDDGTYDSERTTLAGDLVELAWSDADGTPRLEPIRFTPGAAVEVGTVWVSPWRLGAGMWIALAGFLGAVLQWGRAAKAWQRPAPISAEPAHDPSEEAA